MIMRNERTDIRNQDIKGIFGLNLALERIEGGVVDLRDRTSPKKVHDERERLLAELDATINAINDAVILYKPSGDIVRMNPVARRLLNYDETTERKPLQERLENLRVERPDGSPLPLAPYLTRVLKGESFHGILGVLKRACGEDTWLQLSAAPVFSAQGEIIAAIGTATDITALHRADEERIRGLLMLTHDLRNPLTVIQGHTQLFRCFGRLPNKVRDDSLGIGLYVARRLVEAQGGRIWVESGKGQGAAFHFTLPMQK
ncbi:hypothetical protein GSUB_12875 [Geoalkalibacter subterraneus]|uniref:histidine kinase n=2 Tax=Geoalkalibacter subterraneus TaxID=483547 RepID=A0A0B5FIT3_9BACT|nr:hypothetical protein GSUB_12875 [Geoalkalibacter subterraneus]